ncbi:TonB-dependent siderophore receptor [Achromobacter arsenitoxydans]|uniref:TonB-dependent siderophore receptor family protein 11 n=1 Tax=Achromobacter arsenitoxydans SY8 TaxID=477184 RepID=H0FD33_9BURK|nr:TonB-dependent siderophore receptor [Achromobacter arsenitoxydans]EHK63826.1 TonB-dependent siderophore receptor family protein 11 [Achromobacter arsenitoxydans SY8]
MASMRRDGLRATRPRKRTGGHTWAFAAVLALAALAGKSVAALDAPAARASLSQPYAVPAGSLVSVLQRIASEAGVLVYFDPALTRDLSSDGLNGRYTVEQAFEQVLSAHGLEARQDLPGSYQVLPAWTPSAELLPLTRVEGAAVGADGFVARSATAATKTATPINRIPQSVSVVTAQEMQARAARTVTQALQYTPGVQVNNFGSNEVRNDWLVLRGFDAKLTGDYRDGLSQMPYDQIRARVPAYALESIEAVRGPSSSLYGQVAPGGIVNRVTKRPTDVELREIAVQAGSFDNRQAFLDLGGAAGERGRASYRLTATLRDAGTQDKYDDGHRYRDDLAYVAPAFRWGGADTSLTVLAHYQRDRNDGESRAYYPTRTLVGDYGYDRNERDFHSVGYLFEHRIGDAWMVRQNARYQSGSATLRNLYPLALGGDGRTLARMQLAARERADGVAVDTQIEGVIEGAGLRHTVLAGLDYRRLTGRQEYRQAAAPALDIENPVYNQPIAMPGADQAILDLRQVSTQMGLYLQDQIQAGDWTLTLGVRHDRLADETDDHLAGTRVRARDDALTWRAGVSYAFASGAAPYASYATGFLPQPGTDFGGSPFSPAESRQVEAGMKYQPPDSRDLYTLAVFDLNQRNALSADPDPAHAGFSVQSGRLRSRGLELEAKISAREGWDLVAAYTYNLVTNESSNDGGQGKTPIVTPRHMAALWVGHRFSRGALAGWQAGLGARYIGSTYVDVANTMKNRGATVFDAQLAYDAGAWRFSVDAMNLFNQEAVVCRNDRVNCRYGVERTVLAAVAYRY